LETEKRAPAFSGAGREISMNVRWIRRPSPAFAAAMIALFVALGGTAGAVTAGAVPLARRALTANNAQKLGGLTATQVQAGAAPAFALVDPNGGSPRLVEAHTRGFVDVTVGPFGPGDYCLTPAPGVDVVNTAAVASAEAFYTNALGVPMVRYPTAGPTCGANQLEVKTFDENVQLSNKIAFTVVVP
jgi:hypothetical protein